MSFLSVRCKGMAWVCRPGDDKFCHIILKVVCVGSTRLRVVVCNFFNIVNKEKDVVKVGWIWLG